MIEQFKFHILIVDDDEKILSLLSKYLINAGYYVSIANNAFAAKDQCKEFSFDLVIVDIMMPGENGVELTSYLKLHYKFPVIMLTAMGNPEDRVRGLEKGADDYMVKPFEPKELLFRINNILSKNDYVNQYSSIVILGDLKYDFKTSSLIIKNQDIALTSSELVIFEYLLKKRGEIISRLELCALFGDINERTIDVQIIRIRKKIEIDIKRPRYLKTVRGVGYTIG